MKFGRLQDMAVLYQVIFLLGVNRRNEGIGCKHNIFTEKDLSTQNGVDGNSMMCELDAKFQLVLMDTFLSY
jgi:hypothetical protein